MFDQAQLTQLKKQFKGLEKASSDSFFKQKNVIKQVLAGKSVNCLNCQQPLAFYRQGKSVEGGEICCAKGCTSIALDLES